MEEILQDCLRRYEQVVGRVKYRKVDTPFLDEKTLTEEDYAATGQIAGDACAILMKVLWAARVCRWALLRQVCALASFVSTRTVACGKCVYRLMCHIHHTVGMKLEFQVGDSSDQWQLELYTDADLSKALMNRRSTSGSFLAVVGPRTIALASASAAKQTATSESTPEPELVSASKGLRTCAIPLLDLYEALTMRRLRLKSFKDNETANSR